MTRKNDLAAYRAARVAAAKATKALDEANAKCAELIEAAEVRGLLPLHVKRIEAALLRGEQLCCTKGRETLIRIFGADNDIVVDMMAEWAYNALECRYKDDVHFRAKLARFWLRWCGGDDTSVESSTARRWRVVCGRCGTACFSEAKDDSEWARAAYVDHVFAKHRAPPRQAKKEKKA